MPVFKHSAIVSRGIHLVKIARRCSTMWAVCDGNFPGDSTFLGFCTDTPTTSRSRRPILLHRGSSIVSEFFAESVGYFRS
jgi:hypothetical protein